MSEAQEAINEVLDQEQIATGEMDIITVNGEDKVSWFHQQAHAVSANN